MLPPDQVGRDLRRANLSYAFMIDADFSGAQLEGANFFEARLEGANLFEARLKWAKFFGARLEEANLVLARLEGAILWKARLEGANLSGARLEGANLSLARLEGANLSLTDLRRSKWAGASNRVSWALGADLRGARLTQAQLENVIGIPGTLLPDGNAPDTGAPFYVWSCWETPPPDLDPNIATAAGLFADDADRAAWRAEFLRGPDNPRRKTGTPLALDAPYPEGHPLADRD